MEKNCILGLDISTSVIGVSFLDENDGSLVLLAHIEFPKKIKNLYDKANYAKKELAKLTVDLKISKIWVEESLQSFRSGFSSAKTLSILSKMNALISYIAREMFGVEPEYISAPAARRQCGIKILNKKQGCTTPAKEQTFLWATSGPLKHISFPKKKTGKYKNYCYDEVDSWVVGMSGFLSKHKKL